MKKEKIFKRICGQKFAVLASYDGQYPYCSLMSFHITEDLKEIYIATSKNTHKYKNIITHRKVSLLIDNSSNLESDLKKSFSITVLGDAEEVSDYSKHEIQKAFLDKYPTLRGFLEEETTSLIKIKAEKYICIDNFSEVSEIIF